MLFKLAALKMKSRILASNTDNLNLVSVRHCLITYVLYCSSKKNQSVFVSLTHGSTKRQNLKFGWIFLNNDLKQKEKLK